MMRPLRGGAAPMQPMQLLTAQLRQSVVTAAVTGGQEEGGPGGKSSAFRGVSFSKARSAWMADVWDPGTRRKQYIGFYASEDDAARAYDCAAVEMHGTDAKLNVPGKLLRKAPVSLGDERKQRKTSRFIGVSFNKSSSTCKVQIWDPVTKRKWHIGSYASEVEAA
ncbi:hypothetical protein FOA52_004467 [Chlamydomonas sp. UWO 241]|nr:hypothetical protein FOA52_004467 [Chlamydomonas sp. UWO 241]